MQKISLRFSHPFTQDNVAGGVFRNPQNPQQQEFLSYAEIEVYLKSPTTYVHAPSNGIIRNGFNVPPDELRRCLAGRDHGQKTLFRLQSDRLDQEAESQFSERLVFTSIFSDVTSGQKLCRFDGVDRGSVNLSLDEIRNFLKGDEKFSDLFPQRELIRASQAFDVAARVKDGRPGAAIYNENKETWEMKIVAPERIDMKFVGFGKSRGTNAAEFLPVDRKIKGHNVLMDDSTLDSCLFHARKATVKVTSILHEPYRFAIGELQKAKDAREKYLSQQFKYVANRLHRADRALPVECYKFEALHKAENQTWIARYRNGAAKSQDFSLEQLKDYLKANPKDAVIKMSERQVLRGINELTYITRGYIRDPASRNLFSLQH